MEHRRYLHHSARAASTGAALLILLIGCGGTTGEYMLAGDPGGPFVLIDSVRGVEIAVQPDHGGEISSLKFPFRGRSVETLYLANDYSPREGWTGKAPLLWPATGGTRGGYEILGERRLMPGHGFARDMPWTLDDSGVTSSRVWVRLSLEDSPSTREAYPFGFRLEVEHSVSQGVVTSAYKVEAKADNDGAMPYSIGNHITFNTPLLEDSDWREMIFRTPSAQMFLKQEGGFPSGEMEPRSYADGVRLEDWPVKVPISLTGYDGAPWMELEDPGGLRLRMSHSAPRTPKGGYVAFNVWGDPPNGYFSPEPWMGMQNSLNLGRGLIRLEPGEATTWTIEIRSY